MIVLKNKLLIFAPDVALNITLNCVTTETKHCQSTVQVYLQ